MAMTQDDIFQSIFGKPSGSTGSSGSSGSTGSTSSTSSTSQSSSESGSQSSSDTSGELAKAKMAKAILGGTHLLQGVAGFLEGRRAADQLEDRGDLAMRLANIEARRVRRDRNRRIGRLVSAQSGSGFQINRGTQLEVLVDETFEAAMDVGMVRLQGRIDRADLRAKAASARNRATASLIGGFGQAFASQVPRT